MKRTITTALVLFWVTLCFAQTADSPKTSAISLEIGKTGLIYNLNFDYKPASKNFGFRVGAGSNLGQYLNVKSVGGGGYYLVGDSHKFFEIGLDVQYLVVDEVSDDQLGFASIVVFPDFSVKTIYPSLNLGYRRYGKKSLFRIGFSPGVIKSKLIPGGYVSYGFIF